MPLSLTSQNPSERLAVALFLAAGLHAVVILGVGFNAHKHKRPDNPPISMEVTLVHSHSEEAPKKADYLAQANQQGGGNVKEKVRPASPFANPTALSQRGSAPESRPALSPAESRPEHKPVLTTQRQTPLKTAIETQPSRHHTPKSLNADQLVERAREIARLSAEIRQRSEAYAELPRTKTVSANTREYKYAAYEEAWRMKVERIGNINYPDEAKRRNLSGSLILEVALRPDGSVLRIRVVHSSGSKILDDAAVRIVRLASPFAPFPPSIRRDVDVLQIIRTWQFRDNTFSR